MKMKFTCFTGNIMVILLALLLLSTSQIRSETCKANSNSEFIFKVDYHAPALTGAFAVEGCKGSSPVLELRRGVTYTFVQHDVTNWMHPLGFAYYPDGIAIIILLIFL